MNQGFWQNTFFPENYWQEGFWQDVFILPSPGTWRSAYVNLAIAFDATISDIVDDYAHLQEARLAMIDITTIDDDSLPGYGSQPGYGTEASVALLRDMDLLVRQSRLYFRYETHRLKMVKSINDFTVNYFVDLTAFVNTLSWPENCIPFYWAELSEEAGADISGWNICYS